MPAEQTAQLALLEPTAVEYRPALQLEQFAACVWVAYVPALQLVQPNKPVCEAYVPALQLPHAVAPVSDAYVPVAQLVHAGIATHALPESIKPVLHEIGHDVGVRLPGPVKTPLAPLVQVDTCLQPAEQLQVDPVSLNDSTNTQLPLAKDHWHDPSKLAPP